MRLGRAAAGSMRDALSLLDQALAFGDGALRDADVAEMLGSLDRGKLTALMEALAVADAPALLAQVQLLDELAPDYGDVLAGLATLLQQVAVVQVAGAAALDTETAVEDEVALLTRLAAQLAPETVQLMYQIAVMGRRDLALAPDPRTGFEMALLRLVAFHPERLPQAVVATGASAQVRAAAPTPRPAASVTSATLPAGPPDIGNWSAFIASLSVDGAARQLAAHCAVVAHSPFELRLTLDKRNGHLLTENLQARLTAALHERLGSSVKVLYTLAEAPQETPATLQAKTDDDDLRQARELIAADRNVRQMTEMFGAEVIPESVRKNPNPPTRK